MPRRRLAHIERIDYHHFHGWLVRLKRAGKIHQRYFHDHGDRKAALRRAAAWRDQMLEQLPPPRKFARRHILNRTGIIGVTHRSTFTRKGTPVEYYAAGWHDERGRTYARSFSVLKYGRGRAFALARDARQTAIAEMLRPRKPPH